MGGNHFLFHSTTFTRSRTFTYLFATLYVRWQSHIFNRTACIYQAVTRWDLPPYRITIWYIDDVELVFVCLLDELILGFCYSHLDTGNRWTRTCIDYHPCITSELTNQVLVGFLVWKIFHFFGWLYFFIRVLNSDCILPLCHECASE